MSSPFRDFPPLQSVNLEDARLYADRTAMLSALPVPRRGVVAELGVALGTFSATIIELLEPREFVAIDTFTLHEIPMLWGRQTSDIFMGKTHLEFYRDTLSSSSSLLTIRAGLSHTMLETFPDHYFDLIYVDADHSYQAVKQDSAVARRKVRSSGIVVFNDYIVYDHLGGAPYGVVPAVNELVVNEGWRVIGFGLQQQMFCDIALRPPPAS